MPSSPVAAPNPHVQRTFCTRLKTERERRGISLQQIADSTKVKQSLLESFERGDLSRWPKGIFRRAFFRAYLHALGLPAEPSYSDFLELFPDEVAPTNAVKEVLGTDTPARLRLTLAPAPSWHSRISVPQVACTVIDLALVTAFGAVWSWMLATSFWASAGVTAVAYFSASTLCVGRSLTLWWLTRPQLPQTSNATDDVAVSRSRLETVRGWLRGERSRETRESVSGALT